MSQPEAGIPGIVGDEDVAVSNHREQLIVAATGEELVLARRCIYEFRNGDLSGVRIVEGDQAAVDAFISRHFPR